MKDVIVPHLPPGPKLWVLRLSSFQGVAPGAEHWFADLDPGGAGPEGGNDFDDFEVEYRLNADEAARRRRRDPLFSWRAGQRCRGFQTKADATAGALAAWEALKDKGDSITDDWLYEKQVLAGPEGNEHVSPSRYGAGTHHRKLTVLVDRVDGAWRFVRVER